METNVENGGYKVGEIVPYINTRSNQKDAEITSFKTVVNGDIWFYGIDTVTKAKVFYPVHLSIELKSTNE